MTEIAVRGLRVEACHGVLELEKTTPQPFVFDLWMTLTHSRACQSDRLEDTVNYAAVAQTVTQLTRTHCFDLIERLAMAAAEEILARFPLVSTVKVRVGKPNAPMDGEFDTVQVTVELTRPKKVYLSLGSNLGDRREHLRQGVNALASLPQTRLTACSSLYETQPLEADGGAYLNLCIRLETRLSPEELLAHTQRIEAQCGRTRAYFHAPRTLDVDLILFEGETRQSALLTLPHPRAFERRFVLEPLRELDAFAGGFDVEAALSRLPDQGCRPTGEKL